jgi:hypothetical protein
MMNSYTDILVQIGQIKELVNSATIVGGFATAIGVGFALVTVFVTAWQVNINREINRETNALQTHREYLKLCIEYPHLSCSIIFQEDNPEIELDKITKYITRETEQYLWFISFMLNTYEQIFLMYPKNSEWRSSISSNIEYHMPVIKEIWHEVGEHYNPRFQEFVSSIMGSEVEINS